MQARDDPPQTTAHFALTGMLMLAALVPAIRDRTADGESPGE